MANYPTSLDNTTSLPTRVAANAIPASDNNDKNAALIALETKTGIGVSDAASASTGYIMSKKSDGSTAWQASSALGVPQGSQTMGVVVHGSTAGLTRPTGFASITWIGTVQPTNALSNDIWYDTTA